MQRWKEQENQRKNERKEERKGVREIREKGFLSDIIILLN